VETDKDQIDDDTMLTLAYAARLLFPAGTVTANTLKLRVRQGKLVAYKIGKPYLTTRRDVKAMITLVAVPLTHTTEPTLSDNASRANQALDAALQKLPKK
jgi:ribosomal protein L16/L10AE